MKKLFKVKARGLNESLIKFSRKITDCNFDADGVKEFSGLVLGEMKRLDFDKVISDRVGNLIGVIKGYENKGPIVIISHMDIPSAEERKAGACLESGIIKFKAGIISSIYAAALMKRTLLS